MLKSFSREDLEDLYKLVKAKYGSTRPVEDLDLILWGDLKTMFEPHVEDIVWRNQQNYSVLDWKLYDSCGVHSLRKQNVYIHMLVEKRYPLTPATITDMLNKKLQADHFNFEEEYQVYGRIIGIKRLLDDLRVTAAKVAKQIEDVNEVYKLHNLPEFYKGAKLDLDNILVLIKVADAAARSALERLRPLAFSSGGTHFKYGAAEYIESNSGRSRKARYLRYMVKCLLKGYTSRRKVDNKDDFRNKRLELAGELLEREVKVHLRHAHKLMVKAMPRDLYPVCTIHPIEQYLDAAIITNPGFSFST
ncbi:ribonuclease H-like domain, reverse transcriptase, RNA-dependent DNA polymerase [Tanacetum coccineum]